MACLSGITRSIKLKNCVIFVRHLTSKTAPVGSFCPPQVTVTNNLHATQISLRENPWIWQKNDKIDLPITRKIQIDFPNGLKYVPPLEEPANSEEIELPATINGENTKQAARLIVIRRKKMKKHKLKKLRKRMKFEWAKRRQRRELAKEKAFQALLIKQCKEGEAFDAAKYVEERLAKFNEVIQQKTEIRKHNSVKTQM